MPSKMAQIALVMCVSFALVGCSAPEGTDEQPPASQNEERPDLKEIMVTLGEESGRLNAGLWAEDFDAIAAAADSIANHPNVSDADRTLIQQALGPDFAEFVKGDQRVHATGLALSEAAKGQDLPEVLTLNAQLQRECVACHTAFRDRLADRADK